MFKSPTDPQSVLAGEPKYRRQQIERAWFEVEKNGYDEITTLPLELRDKLKGFPWLTVQPHTVLTSKLDNTRKILFKLHDGNLIETVIMGRKNLKQEQTDLSGVAIAKPDRFTICISSQVGCALRCAFCATGQAGFKRQLSTEEIIDQVRYCQRLLATEKARVANIVMMGQGEPLLNYDNVKHALQIILANTDIGPTKIMISTTGIPLAMDKLIADKDFPPVRWTISLHSAIEETREKIMPAGPKDFLKFLVGWVAAYHKKLGTRAHFIGLEYIMLGGINDDEKHLQALIKLCKKLPHIRVNIIPYNNTCDEPPDNKTIFFRAAPETIEHWHDAVMKAGFTSTIRYSQGQDIAAACGQLRNKVK